jgi:hypothetical protein
MHLALLIVLTACLPAAWGYCMFWLLARFWPPRKSSARSPHRSESSFIQQDYQI